MVAGVSTVSSSDYFVLTTGRAVDDGRYTVKAEQRSILTDIASSGTARE